MSDAPRSPAAASPVDRVGVVPPQSAPDRVDALDAVRGYAILAVLAIHCSSVLPPTSPWLVRLVGLGPRGVQLFYIASGFVMFLWVRRRPIGSWQHLWAYAARRIARLAPMYWLAIIAYYSSYARHPSALWAPYGVGAREIALNVVMLHTWWPEAANSVVPGGWSVGVEVTFYALVPVLTLLITNLWTATAVLVLAVLFDYSMCQSFMGLYSSFPTDGNPMLEQFADVISFPPQIPAFASGIVLFFVWDHGLRLRAFPALMLMVMSGGACWALSNDVGYWFMFYDTPITMTNLTLVSIAMLPGVAGLVLCPSLRFNNPAARYLGKISFSIYLIHLMIINKIWNSIRFFPMINHPSDVAFVSLLVLTGGACLLLSSVTFTYVEEAGKRLFLWLLIGGRQIVPPVAA